MPLGYLAGAVLVAGLANAAVGAYSASNAAGIANTQLGMEQTVFGEQQQYEQQLNQLLANPSSVTATPGYKFGLDTGARSLADQMAAMGYAGSGNLGVALTEFGQNYGMNAWQQQINNLMALSGITAPSSPSQYGSGAIGAQANSFNQMGQVLASLGYMSKMYSGGSAGTGTGFGGFGYGGAGAGAVDLSTTDFSASSLFGGAAFPSTGYAAAAAGG